MLKLKVEVRRREVNGRAECTWRTKTSSPIRRLLPFVGLLFPFALLVSTIPSTASGWQATQLPAVVTVGRQPLLVQVRRLQEAMEQIGSPLSDDLQRGVKELNSVGDDARVAARVQELLDPLCLAAVTLQRDAKPLVVSRGGEVPLVEQGWQPSLIKVINEPELRQLRPGAQRRDLSEARLKNAQSCLRPVADRHVADLQPGLSRHDPTREQVAN